ncbi:MAG: hypothetical protein ACLSXJ_14210 [Clostridium saudiense]|uniref:hypothetical protein n=1 Tax=Clostridium saudiense TaxID=1414720 RepID=UPI0012B7E572
MAWDYYLNLEIISLEIVEQNINKMTDDNFYSDLPGFINQDEFLNNFKYGYVSILMLESYIESSLNTIIRDVIKCTSNKKLKLNIYDKITYIYTNFKISTTDLFNSKEYIDFSLAKSIRNDLIHYKFNSLGLGSAIPVGANNINAIGKYELYNYFTKTNMTYVKEGIKKFLYLIANDLNLKINTSSLAIVSDGKDPYTPYISK